MKKVIAETIEDKEVKIIHKKKVVATSQKAKKVRKEISLDEEMIAAIKSFHRGTVSSYCLMAIQNQMRDDGIL